MSERSECVVCLGEGRVSALMPDLNYGLNDIKTEPEFKVIECEPCHGTGRVDK